MGLGGWSGAGWGEWSGWVKMWWGRYGGVKWCKVGVRWVDMDWGWVVGVG